MRDHMRAELPLAASMMTAQRQRPETGLIYHFGQLIAICDRGYVNQLAAIGPTPSMNRTGNSYYSPTMESYFHTLTIELVHQCR